MRLPSQASISALRDGCYSQKKPEGNEWHFRYVLAFFHRKSYPLFLYCHLWAGFIRATENDLQKAVQLYRVNCDDYGYANSCLEYGTVAFTGVKEKNVKSDPVEALKYFEKGCSLGSSDNCLNSGMLLVSPMLEKTALKRDLPKGIDYLKKSCDMNNGNACFYLSGMYMSGANASSSVSDQNKTESDKSKDSFVLEKDMKMAFSLTTKAYGLKNVYACANLSRMYALGDGTEKNLEKSKQYEKRSEELRDEFNRQRILAQFNHP